jgi:hypothetical protein
MMWPKTNDAFCPNVVRAGKQQIPRNTEKKWLVSRTSLVQQERSGSGTQPLQASALVTVLGELLSLVSSKSFPQAKKT